MVETGARDDAADISRLRKAAVGVVETLTDPNFINKIQQARSHTDDAGNVLDVLKHHFSIEGLREAGVDIPADFRMTSRVFEDVTSEPRIQVSEDLEPVAAASNFKDNPQAGGFCAGGSFRGIRGCAGFKL
jgi:hypothetical protein